MESPVDYMNDYLDIKVPADAETKQSPARVKVYKYRNNGLTGTLGTTAAMGSGGSKDALVEKLKETLKLKHFPSHPVVAAKADNRDITISATKVVGVYAGKGSPQDIADILWLARHLALVDVQPSSDGPKKRLRHDATWTLQHYCDAYVGLDCNGFVGNYVEHVMGKPGFDPSTPITYYPSKGVLRTRLDDVAPLDLLIWPDYGHIAIIGSLGARDADTSLNCTVTESTAAFEGGLHSGPYTLRPHNNDKAKLFKVSRHTGKGDTTVYVVGLR